MFSKEESDELNDPYDNPVVMSEKSGAVDMDELVQMVTAFKQSDSSTPNRTELDEAWGADSVCTVSLITSHGSLGTAQLNCVRLPKQSSINGC